MLTGSVFQMFSWQGLSGWLFINYFLQNNYKHKRPCRPNLLTNHRMSRYAVHALEKNSVGFGSSDLQRRTTASSAVFFRPLHGSFMGEPCRASSDAPGSFSTGTPTCTVPPTRLASGSEFETLKRRHHV